MSTLDRDGIASDSEVAMLIRSRLRGWGVGMRMDGWVTERLLLCTRIGDVGMSRVIGLEGD